MFSRSTMLALAVAFGAAGLANPATAACTGGLDVAAAFAKQREKKAFRMDANVISGQGPLKMTVDYVLPDRLHQTVQIIVEQRAIDAVLIGAKAWANEGDGWREAPADIKDELERQLTDVAEETSEQVAGFECLGRELIDGRELAAYKAQEGPKDMSPDAASKAPTNETVRIVYVDPATGLPARTVIGRPDKLDRPLYKAIYSYPDDLKIEPPVVK